MAVTVLVGWHAHIRAAIQIFPEWIPIQYNTALCFLAVGAAGIGLSTRKRLLMLAGGGVAALMGATVVLEYATGTSFGIDTLFFYPWERTLSADLGRMALTTAISFVLTGVAFVVLAVRRNAYAIVGVLNLVPLSLALTSLIGYAFRIDYVLPFSVGSQMAMHTSVAFLANGMAMLGYAWTYAERGPDGLPRWGAGIGVALLPVLLVGASALFPAQSWPVVLVEVLFSVVGVALIALAVFKLTTAKVAYKGLLMIATPLVLLLVFVGLVVHVKRQSDSAQVLARHSTEVLGAAQSLLVRITEAESAVRGYVITGDSPFVSSYASSAAEIAQTTARLRNLVSDNPLQEANATRIERLASERMDHLSRVVQLVETDQKKQAEEEVRGGTGRALMQQVRTEMDTFSREEERLDAERRQSLDASWQALSWLLVAGTAAAILMASILSLLFSGGISKRLERLRDNAISLTAGRELAPPLTGHDEIAELDRVFHAMAESLDEVTRREKAVIEGTTDGVFVRDLQHRVLMINQAGAAFLGKTVDDVIGLSVQDLFAAESARRILERDDEILAKGTTETYELTTTTKTGIERTFLTTKAPYRDRHGNVVGIIGINRDITEQKRAKEALVESDRRFRDLFYEAPVGYHELDSEGRITCVNTTELSMLGYSSEEMIGHHVWDFIKEAETARRMFAEKLALRRPLGHVERSFRRKDGTFVDVQLDDQMLRDPDGRIIGIRATMQDITERKRTEEALKQSEQRFRDLFENASDVIYTADFHGNFTSLNRSGERMTGYTREEALHLNFAQVVSPESLKRMTEMTARTRTSHDETVFELEIFKKSGEPLLVEISSRAIRKDGKPVGIQGIGRDITQRKQVEAELERARDVALESVRLKSEFLAIMSHEIRTPMNGVIGMTGLLLETDLSASQREYAETIQSSADALLRIIDDILDFSKLEAGLLRFEKIDFNLRGAVEATVHLLAERAQAKGVELTSLVHADVPTALQGDPGRLRQVLLNLAGNAVKFTGQGEVVVTVKKVSGTASHVTLRFEIQDTGIGISADAQRGLFRAFTQADGSTTRKYGGTGLGLAISRQLVERMGGKIGIESTPGHGSIFWFTAEFETQPESAVRAGHTAGSLSSASVLVVDNNAANRKQHRDQSAAGVRILVAEDSVVNRKVALGQLRNLGYRAEAVENGRELLTALDRGHVDVILMDCQMPEMDGFAATAEIRRREGTSRHTIIIAMTANALDGDKETCLAAGMDDYLSKPVKSDVLRQKLAWWTGTGGSGKGSSGGVIDQAQLAILRGIQGPGESDWVTEVIDLFLKDAASRLEALREGLRRDDAVEVHRVAHLLKGSSASMGATRMATLSGELENDDSAGGAKELMAQLDSELVLVREALKAERKETGK